MPMASLTPNIFKYWSPSATARPSRSHKAYCTGLFYFHMHTCAGFTLCHFSIERHVILIIYFYHFGNRQRRAILYSLRFRRMLDVASQLHNISRLPMLSWEASRDIFTLLIFRHYSMFTRQL